MNKLTTINTITKAAPLALLAVVMSGSAFAGPDKGQGPKDKGPKGEPQASVEVFNKCSYKEYMGTTYKPTLVIETTIKNTSGDTLVDAELTKIVVKPKQKTRGKAGPLGAEKTANFVDPQTELPTYIDNYDKFESFNTEYIDICASLDNHTLDTSLNAEIDVSIENSKFGVFSGECDDNLETWCEGTDEEGNIVDVYCEAEDESIVEIAAHACY